MLSAIAFCSCVVVCNLHLSENACSSGFSLSPALPSYKYHSLSNLMQVGGPGRALAAPGPDSVVIKVPNDKVGLIIGKGGETIKSMQTRSGARIQVSGACLHKH
jgi:hypothetical protein